MGSHQTGPDQGPDCDWDKRVESFAPPTPAEGITRHLRDGLASVVKKMESINADAIEHIGYIDTTLRRHREAIDKARLHINQGRPERAKDVLDTVIGGDR